MADEEDGVEEMGRCRRRTRRLSVALLGIDFMLPGPSQICQTSAKTGLIYKGMLCFGSSMNV